MRARRVVRLGWQALSVSIALLMLGCSSSAFMGSNERDVAIRTFSFRPTMVRIEPGRTVRWTNRDDILHTVTSGRAGEQGVPGVSEGVSSRPDGRFDLELAGAGSTATVTLELPGPYPYFCEIHAGMLGRIVVG